MHVVPGLRLRADDDSEILGIDDAEMGEFAYDYVGLEAEINPKHEMGARSTEEKGSVQDKERSSV
jgi:Amt family ammonium transporter